MMIMAGLVEAQQVFMPVIALLLWSCDDRRPSPHEGIRIWKSVMDRRHTFQASNQQPISLLLLCSSATPLVVPGYCCDFKGETV